MLTNRERRLFRRLAVFVGSFSLGAAEAVGTTPGDDADAVLGALESLVRDGLLVRSEGRGHDGCEPRLALLETIREFALEKLEMSGELPAAQRAHAAFYTALVKEAAPWLRTGEQLAWLERLDAEQVNLRAALAWATMADVSLGLRLVAAAWDYWDLRAVTFEVIDAALLLIAQSNTPAYADAPERLRAMATMVCPQSWPVSMNVARWALADECLARCRAAGDGRGIARSLLRVADRLFYVDPERAVGLLEEGLTLARELGESWVAGRILAHLGRIARNQGDRAGARAWFTESLAAFRGTGDRQGIVYALIELGDVVRAAGAYPEAEAFLIEGLTLSRSLGSDPYEVELLASLSHVAYDRGDVATAHARLQEGIARARERGSRGEWADSLLWRRNIARDQGEDGWAALAHQASLTLLGEIEAMALGQEHDDGWTRWKTGPEG